MNSPTVKFFEEEIHGENITGICPSLGMLRKGIELQIKEVNRQQSGLRRVSAKRMIDSSYVDSRTGEKVERKRRPSMTANRLSKFMALDKFKTGPLRNTARHLHIVAMYLKGVPYAKVEERNRENHEPSAGLLALGIRAFDPRVGNHSDEQLMMIAEDYLRRETMGMEEST